MPLSLPCGGVSPMTGGRMTGGWERTIQKGCRENVLAVGRKFDKVIPTASRKLSHMPFRFKNSFFLNNRLLLNREGIWDNFLYGGDTGGNWSEPFSAQNGVRHGQALGECLLNDEHETSVKLSYQSHDCEQWSASPAHQLLVSMVTGVEEGNPVYLQLKCRTVQKHTHQ